MAPREKVIKKNTYLTDLMKELIISIIFIIRRECCYCLEKRRHLFVHYWIFVENVYTEHTARKSYVSHASSRRKQSLAKKMEPK